MAGTVHGMVNKSWPRYAVNNYYNMEHLFAAIAQFFDHLSTAGGGNILTRIASNFSGGTGFDFPGGSNPIGYNQAPMGVWKMNTSTLRPGGGSALGEIYIFLAGFGPSPYRSQDFGLLVGNDTSAQGKIGIQVCFREDGGNPWNGGVVNTGSDRPGSPVWDAGASTLHFLCPRACNPGGSYNTNKECLSNFADGNGNWYAFDIVDAYFHGVADDDNLLLFYTSQNGVQSTDEPKDYACFYLGTGELFPNCGSDPYFSYSWLNTVPGFNRGSTYGDTAGTQDNQGGVKQPRGQVIGLQASTFQTGLDQNRSPNPYSPGGVVFDEKAVQIYVSDGVLGYGHEPSGDDFWRFIYGVPNESLDATNERAAFGANSTLSEKITIPWPSTIGEAPGATRTYAGVTF